MATWTSGPGTLVIPLVIPPGATRPYRSALDDPTNVSCKESTQQQSVDDPLLSWQQQVGGSSPPASSHSRRSQACRLDLLGSMSFLAIGTDRQAALRMECRRTGPSRASAQVLWPFGNRTECGAYRSRCRIVIRQAHAPE